MVVRFSPARAGAGRRALLLLAALACCCCVAVQALRAPPKMAGLTPTTHLAAFRPTAAAYTTDLSKLAREFAVRTSYTNYLKACKLPVTPFNQAKAKNLQESLKRVMQANTATKLKHASGLNQFSQMSFSDRAKFLGLRRGSLSWAQTLSSNAATLRATAQLNISAAEAAAEKVFAASEAAREARRVTVAQDEIPDWTLVLPAVKNQGGCGSCWAFAATALTEAASFAQTGTVVSLSEKQVLDCATGTFGCDGGYATAALDYIVDAGLTTSTQYPYVARQDSCPAQLPEIASRLASYTQLPANDEGALYEALKTGPIDVAITVDTPFMEYSGGVFSSDSCGGTPNHMVLVVGAGRDDELGVDYWLIRNSWGEGWGEGGYMRILRGVGGSGMCNIAAEAWQATSSDEPMPVPPPAPGPDPGCQDQTITVNADSSLADIAKQYRTTVARIQLDNGLDDPTTQLSDGTSLTISCPSGVWSEPYGVWNNWNTANAMVAMPVEGTCPEGHYAQSFYIKPSQWYTAGAWTGNTWVGQVTMYCSDGTEVTIDAQPDFNPGWADGTVTQLSGFPTVSLMSGWALDSLFGVGAQSGGENTFACPSGMVVTGIAGGASPDAYPKGWVSNLQFRCSNPFGSDAQGKSLLTSLMRASFPKVPYGLSCKTYTASASDTWQSIATKSKVLVNELMRANPQAAGRVAAGKPIFIPPCIDGVLQGTKVRSAGRASAVAVDQKLPLKQALAAAQVKDADALVVAAAAQPAAAAAVNAELLAAAAGGN